MYFVQFLIGGILFVLIYYFSTKKESALTALIPAIPVMGLIGLYYMSSNNKNIISNYMKNAIIYFTLYVIIYFYLFVRNNKKRLYLQPLFKQKIFKIL